MNYIEAVEKSGGVPGPYGERFGRLVVLHLDRVKIYKIPKNPRNARTSKTYYDLCRCDCGTVTVIRRECLYKGSAKSCGCLRRERLKKEHPARANDLYKVYSHMIDKCYNKKHRDYSLFGGNGVTVCARWLESIANFIADVENEIGPRNTGKIYFTRMDRNGNFEPGNICWSKKASFWKKGGGLKFKMVDKNNDNAVDVGMIIY